MKKILVTGLLFSITLLLAAQDSTQVINVKEVERIEKVLSADDMEGRAAFKPGADRAAAFLQKEFKAIGLETPGNSGTYLQDFSLLQTKFISAKARFDEQIIETKNIVAFTSNPDLYWSQDSAVLRAYIKPGDNFNSVAYKYIQSDKSYLVLVDTSFSKEMRRMSGFKRPVFKNPRSTIFVSTMADPKNFEIEVKHDISKLKLTNVVGILPGKSRRNEIVIFSAHYDHLGIGKPDANKDSLYNGANDDASGTTAIVLLAKYFKLLDHNERTLVFAAFTAEEIGGYGSQYFSRQYDPAHVVAMFNIEMIGTESKWGTNSAYITGYEKTDMGKILGKNLEGSPFRFYPDPYPEQQLFYRSDNATLARQGVAAHTISTSKMDSEKYYHTPGDEIGTLDLRNMAEIIKAIAISSSSVISGKDTPTRVDTKQLR